MPWPRCPATKNPAECAVYFFGQGHGGSVEADIDRWKGNIFVKFTGPAKTIAANQKVLLSSFAKD